MGECSLENGGGEGCKTVVANDLYQRLLHEGSVFGLAVFSGVGGYTALGDSLGAGVVGSVAVGVGGAEETSETRLSGAFEGELDLAVAVADFFLAEDAFEGFGMREVGR